MPLPVDLQARLDDPDFWRAYFFQDEATVHDDEEDEDEDESSLVVEFPVGGGYALVLKIYVGLHMVNLTMRTPDSNEALRLGWDDQAHWHPSALRWTELDLIARAAAVLDPALRHPGPVLALAGRFVILGRGDDLDAITPMMEAAFGSPRLPRVQADPMVPMLDIDFGPPVPVKTWWPRTRDWLHRVDGRDRGVVWSQDAAGTWTVGQDKANEADGVVYSLRCPDGDFPFAAWQKLVSAAEATLAAGTMPAPESPAEQCWIDEERVGAPRGSLIAAHFGSSPLRDSRLYLLDLDLPIEGRSHAHALAVCADLDRTLREADRGWADTAGSTFTPGRGWTAFALRIGIFDNLDDGVALIRQVLRRHRTDPETRLTRDREPIPFD
ncbi:hypothetical protein GCM10010112_55880 [Actinoplanes lobatus]|uniref:Uncharacterized protein n=1 Tax=Actinoplanes lobatus TaxID=113568 RepID=A0A7W7MGD1_9ACTN|nr:hypothetical protein [Actinoplanes lobatus]MBB4749193.1 hypothetical protein [Actinoplanes lobatus]GGN80379.1 hypothetical protein GCM10010112_55880 [Actinoplanes lobatus]GIE45248.1 hypothetical protein Alo02nite_81460 [Actinoplanes lobatus]